VKPGFGSLKIVYFSKSRIILTFVTYILEVNLMKSNFISGAFCQLPPEHIINRIIASGKITAADRACLLQAAVSETPLSADLAERVTRLFDRLQMGLLQVVD
jgi:hypothetical protein